MYQLKKEKNLVFSFLTITNLMKKNYNRTRTKIMFNTWLSNVHSKNSIGNVSHVLSLQNKKQISLRLAIISKQSSSLLPTQTEYLSKSFPFFNRSFDKKKLKSLFSWYFANRGEASTFSLVEKLQKFGFSYAMKAGISLGVDDLKVPPKKSEFLTEAVELLANTKASVNSGNVTALEEFQQFVDTWHRTSENLKTSVVQNFSRSSLGLLKQSNCGVSSVSVYDTNAKPVASQVKTSNFSFLEKKKLSSRGELRSPKASPSEARAKIGKKNLISSETLHRLPLFTCTGNDFISSPQKILNERQPLHSMLRKGIKSNKDQYNQKQQLLSRASHNILNPVYMMAFSGARGNLSQVRQLVGMRGLMADPQGQLVEFPIQSNFREGLTVTEYMISCYGARKGLVDTALRTAAAGYLTRRLVDVSHHQIVRFVTCGTKSGILLFDGHTKKEQIRTTVLPSAWKSPLSKNQNNVNSSANGTKKADKKDSLLFCVGRVLARNIPGVAFRNQEIDIALATSPVLRNIYDKSGFFIRSPLTCTAETGICQLCYGWSVSANRLVGLGEAVGIIAAQSIGEPGTQLTMRTFHTGGVFSGDIMEECRAKHAGVVYFQSVYLGLLVRTAGGAIAFCLKTPAILQIKGEHESTSYNISANTLLFVRQGEQVLLDSLLAQIPNLPTTEESSGESTKTIVSELSGEVRQKPTINPQLASLRILAGQECSQFYFFNKNKTSGYSPSSFAAKLPNLLKENNNNQFSSPSWNRLFPNKAKKLVGGMASFARQTQLALASEARHPLLKKKTEGLVTMLWGAHRLGKNKIVAININGAKAQVIVPTFSSPVYQAKWQQKQTNGCNPASKREIENLCSPLNQNSVLMLGSWKANSDGERSSPCQLVKTQLLGELRVFVACKIHSNRVLLTSSIQKNSNNKLATKQLLPLLSLTAPQNKQTSAKDLGLLQLVSIKSQTFPNLKGYNTSNGTRDLSAKNFYYKDLHFKKLKNFFVFAPFRGTGTEKKKVQLFTCNNKEFVKLRVTLLPLYTNRQNFLLSFLSSKNSFYDKEFFSNSNQLLNQHSKNTAIHGIATLSFWPKAYRPNIFDYSLLFWTLQDLFFFRGIYTKTNQIYPQVRILINKNWCCPNFDRAPFGSFVRVPVSSFAHAPERDGELRSPSISTGHKKQSFQLSKNVNVKKTRLGLCPKGTELVNFLYQSQDTSIIDAFPIRFLTLFSRFNIEPPLNTVEKFPPLAPNKVSSQNLLKFTDFFEKKSQPKTTLQDSGEICPLQGNANLTSFQESYRSFQKITNLNSGLLMHYNRVSYKLPLCLCSTTNLIPMEGRASEAGLERSSPDQTYNPVLNKEQLRSMLALSNKNQENNQPNKQNPHFFNSAQIFVCQGVPQIGAFLNTGDEIIKECATAYCGQVIEKSPDGFTLRLTQNILYSNLRNRPAKINKNVKNGSWISKGAPLVTLPYISNVTGDIVAGIPKIEQLFEARGETLDETIDKIWETYKNSIVPRSKAVRECFKEIGLFVVAAIQTVYFSQGVNIADKHLEVIIRQMTRRALIVDPGDTEFLPDEFVDLNTIECVNWATYGESATYRPRLIGITKASLTSNSFLSAASFQQTARVLERETILEKTDRLLGLKERVMMGALINAGTGELKTSVLVSDRSQVKLSTKLVKRLNFFSRRKVKATGKKY